MAAVSSFSSKAQAPFLFVLLVAVAGAVGVSLHAPAPAHAATVFYDICGSSGRSVGGPCNIRCLRPDPVCGINGVTYWCGCPEALCFGVPVVKRGPCGGQPPRN